MKSKKISKSYLISDVIFKALGLLRFGRLIILLMTLSLALGLVFYSYSRSVYEARGTIKYELFRYAVQDEAVQSKSGGSYIPMLRALMVQLRSEYLTKMVAEELKLADASDSFVQIRSSVFPAIRVEPLSEGMLEIYVQAFDPKAAREAPAILAKVYSKYQNRLRQEQRDSHLQAYKEELEELAKKVDFSSDQSADYIRENSMIETFIDQNQLTEVPREMITTKHRLTKVEQVKESLENGNLTAIAKLSVLSSFQKEPTLQVGQLVPVEDGGPGPLKAPASTVQKVIDPALLNSADAWEEYEKELRSVKSEIVLASNTYLPGHAQMIALKNREKELTNAIEGELIIALQRFELEEINLHERLKKLEGQLPEYRQVIRDYERFSQKYSVLRKEKEAWNNAYKNLQERINALDFEGDKEKVSVRFAGLIEDSGTPISPNKRKIFYASLALGLALGFGVPGLMEVMKGARSRVQDLEEDIELKGLGMVPLTTTGRLESIVRSADADAHAPDFLLESFRIVRTGIAFDKEAKLKSQAIMVTSARPGEGKSAVSANLAWAFSSMNEKTLLIDADLRRGRQHNILNLPNKVGLAQVLMGQGHLDDAIQATSVPGLDFLPRGPIIAGASEKLCAAPFEAIIEQCRKHYHRIIIDTPPVLGLSETISIQRLADGVVLVVKAGETPTWAVRSAIDHIHKAGGEFYGFVLNRIDLSVVANSYNYYYYSSTYYAYEEGQNDA